MTKEQVRKYFDDNPFQSFGARGKEVDFEYFIATTTDKKYLAGSVYAVNWTEEKVIELNITSYDLLDKPKKSFSRPTLYQRTRDFSELDNLETLCNGLNLQRHRELISKTAEKDENIVDKNPHYTGA